jgi:hypothetical protein
VVVMSGIPAMIGLLSVGIFADGLMGVGWQRTGMESFLDVAGQGVSGLFVANGLQMGFPGQFQAQLIGALTLTLWGFITGTLVCAPLAVLFHGVELAATGHAARSAPRESADRPLAVNGQPTADNHHQRLQERLEREEMRQDAAYVAPTESLQRPFSESPRRRSQ